MLKDKLGLGSDLNNKQIGQVLDRKSSRDKDAMSAANLYWVGLGGIIGAGFFLASGLSIQQAGPGVIIAYMLGALLVGQVAGAITTLSVNHPVRGSFRVYAEEFLGPYFGFMVGWAFWISSILGIGSETIAMSIFTTYWLPTVPIWLTALVFAAVVIGLNAFGVKNFGRIESLMSIVKVAALAGFIIVGLLTLFGVFVSKQPVGTRVLLGHGGFLPYGMSGVLRSMLIVIFAYAGISIVAMASSEVVDPEKTIPKATLRVVLSLVILYVLSVFVVTSMQPWTSISANQSPFVAALSVIDLPWLAAIMNAIILVAAFSVMTGAFFGAMTMLISLGDAGQAPRLFGRPAKNGVFYWSLLAGAVGVLLTVLVSYLLPAKVYDYITSASAYFSFLNWSTILACFLLLLRRKEREYISPLSFGTPWMTWITLVIIVVLFGFSLTVVDQRMGFYAFLGFILIISVGYWFYRRKPLRRQTD